MTALLIEEVRSKTFKARNKFQGSGSSKGTSSTTSCSFLSDMTKWCWQMLIIHQPTMFRPCWGTIPLNWNQRQLGFITLRIVAMNPGCWGRVFISLSFQAPTKVKNRELSSQDFTGGGFNEVEKICSSNGFHVLQFSGWTHSEIWTQTPPTV